MWPFGRKESSSIPNERPIRRTLKRLGTWPFRRQMPLGQRGECLAVKTLKRKGLKLLARNYRCPHGEIDLIMLDRSTRKLDQAETIVFVEVKTRSSDKYTSPQTAVNAAKRKHIRKSAHYYLSRRNSQGYNVRYDIVAIVIAPNKQICIDHLIAVF